MNTTEQQILNALYEFISDSKREMFDRIASERTNYITVGMENILKEHNASAVIRSCDCFGVQHLHTIEKNREYAILTEISKGAGTWVDVHSYTTGNDPTLDCIQQLRDQGYRIVATSPHTEKTVQDIDISSPIALIFGTERDGISQQAIQLADETIGIPMVGFTESLNVSVSTAILLHELRNRLATSALDWKLSEEEQTRLKITWCTSIINNGSKVEQEIRRRILEKE